VSAGARSDRHSRPTGRRFCFPVGGTLSESVDIGAERPDLPLRVAIGEGCEFVLNALGAGNGSRGPGRRVGAGGR
jgi:hypothetical protein